MKFLKPPSLDIFNSLKIFSSLFPLKNHVSHLNLLLVITIVESFL